MWKGEGMSKKAVYEFVNKVNDNPTLIERIRSKGTSFSHERYAQAVLVGKEQGFDFTEQELRSLGDDAVRFRDGELTDKDLEAVVGGFAVRDTAVRQLLRVINGGVTT